MININVVARIADDKNFFLDLIYLLHKLKEDNVNDVQVLFIGAIQNYGIYDGVLNMADLLSVADNISFTKASIRVNELPADVQQGYFLHFCVGDFIGYSGMESIQNGYKNIFYNADRRVKPEARKYTNVCGDMNALIAFVKRLTKEQAIVDEEISQNSQQILDDFALTANDKSTLLSLLVPNK